MINRAAIFICLSKTDRIMGTPMADEEAGVHAASKVMSAQQLKQFLTDLHKTWGKCLWV